MRTIASSPFEGIKGCISKGINEMSVTFRVPDSARIHGMHKPYKCDFAENRKKLEEKENGSL